MSFLALIPILAFDASKKGGLSKSTFRLGEYWDGCDAWQTPGQTLPGFTPALSLVQAEVIPEQLMFAGSVGRGWCCIAVQVRDVLSLALVFRPSSSAGDSRGSQSCSVGSQIHRWSEMSEWEAPKLDVFPLEALLLRLGEGLDEGISAVPSNPSSLVKC